MKRFNCLPVAALVLAACNGTELSAPSGIDVASVRPVSSWSNALLTFESSQTATAEGYSLSSSSVTTSPSGQSFLGRFTNEIVTLQVPAGSSSLSLNFRLYIIGSWDGYGGRRYGSDLWSVTASCAGSSSVLKSFTTDFSNKVTTKQHFPNDVGGALVDGLTSAVADVLGYNGVLTSTKGKGSAADASYQLSFDLPAHSCSGPVNFVFSSPSQGLQATADESWGLDDIAVTGT